MFKSIKFLKWLLLPFGIVHLWIVVLRNKFFDLRIFKSKRLAKPVISIGNIQLGGTGKTPLTIYVLKNLQNEGLKVGVLSRGYKRKLNQEIIVNSNADQENNFHESIGDEPALLLENMIDGVLGIGSQRYNIGKKLLQENYVDLFLLDDSLQHRKLHRDLDICLIDVSRWQQHPLLFPFSYLRDTKSSLKRCHAVILTKIGNQKAKAEELKKRIMAKYDIPVFEGDLEPLALINIKNKTEIRLADLIGKKVAAFCGIANSDHFFSMLEQAGAHVVLEKRFSDHHYYQSDDLQHLKKILGERGINIAITTQKDVVKLRSLFHAISDKNTEFYYLKVEFEIREMDEFNKLFAGLLSSKNFE